MDEDEIIDGIKRRTIDSMMYENVENDGDNVDQMCKMRLSGGVGFGHDSPLAKTGNVDTKDEVSPVQKLISKFDGMNSNGEVNDQIEILIEEKGFILVENSITICNTRNKFLLVMMFYLFLV